MGWIDYLRGKNTAATEVKASRAAAMLVQGHSAAKWTPRNYAQLAREGYQLNVIAYQAINRIAEAVSGVVWTAWAGDKEVPNHPILALLARPNQSQSGPEMMASIVGFLMISGNTYVERVQVGGRTKELYALRADRCKIIAGQAGAVAGYTYEVGNQKMQWNVEPNGTCDILHMKLFNPLDDWYGMGPIEAGAYAVDQHNETMQWMQSLLQNSARPSGAFQTRVDGALSDEQFERLKHQIEEQHQGSRNAGRPMLLEGGMTWSAMGLSPVDVALLETKYSAARDVSLAFGVPPQLLNIPGDNTYSNYKEARLAFYEDTVLPLVARLAGGLSMWFEVETGGIELRPDLDQITAIAEKREALWAMADTSADLTLNERRALKGYGPVAGGDVVLVGSGLISLADAAAPLEARPPSGVTDDMKALARIAGYDAKAD